MPEHVEPDEPDQPPAHVHSQQCPVREQHGSHLIYIGPYGGEIHYMRCVGKNGRDLDQRVF